MGCPGATQSSPASVQCSEPAPWWPLHKRVTGSHLACSYWATCVLGLEEKQTELLPGPRVWKITCSRQSSAASTVWDNRLSSDSTERQRTSCRCSPGPSLLLVQSSSSLFLSLSPPSVRPDPGMKLEIWYDHWKLLRKNDWACPAISLKTWTLKQLVLEEQLCPGIGDFVLKLCWGYPQSP